MIKPTYKVYFEDENIEPALIFCKNAIAMLPHLDGDSYDGIRFINNDMVFFPHRISYIEIYEEHFDKYDVIIGRPEHFKKYE